MGFHGGNPLVDPSPIQCKALRDFLRTKRRICQPTPPASEDVDQTGPAAGSGVLLVDALAVYMQYTDLGRGVKAMASAIALLWNTESFACASVRQPAAVEVFDLIEGILGISS